MKRFQKVLVANRGEIAVRIFQTLEQLGYRTVALVAEADQQSYHAQCAHERIVLTGQSVAETYLNISRIIKKAKASGVEAIHPGYGFLSENAEFAQACQQAGIVFIGPSPTVIQQMGNKVVARGLMMAAGVPVLPAVELTADDSTANWLTMAEKIGYPVLVKAAAGGGGKGMRTVYLAEELIPAIQAASREAASAFGNAQVFLEKYLEHPRHIEVQVFGDLNGNIVHLFERECSIQRRHQKIIEESPSPALQPQVREKLTTCAVQAAQAIGYTNAGTVEFLLAPNGTDVYFLEMNTRLQVEHPVTEWITGVDLVAEQLRVAQGEPLSITQSSLKQTGHALECRLYAEDPARQFFPATGTVQVYQPPSGPGIRLDSGIQQGSAITVHYDPMLGKLSTWGQTRDEAIRRMTWALEHFALLGVTHNLFFLLQVLQHPEFKAGNTHTHFLQQNLISTVPSEETLAEALMVVALLEQHSSGVTPSIKTGSLSKPVLKGAIEESPWQKLASFGRDAAKPPFGFEGA